MPTLTNTRAILPAGGSETTTLDLLSLVNLLPDTDRTITVSIVDFSRVMVIVDARNVGLAPNGNNPAMYGPDDPELCAVLEDIRQKASLAAGHVSRNTRFVHHSTPVLEFQETTSPITLAFAHPRTHHTGLGECAGKDSPKICAVAPPTLSALGNDVQLQTWYWVNPGRAEVHPSLAITAANCLAAACCIPGTVASRVSATAPSWDKEQSKTFNFKTPLGQRSTRLWRKRKEESWVVDGASYENEVRLIATGSASAPPPPAMVEHRAPPAAPAAIASEQPFSSLTAEADHTLFHGRAEEIPVGLNVKM